MTTESAARLVGAGPTTSDEQELRRQSEMRSEATEVDHLALEDGQRCSTYWRANLGLRLSSPSYFGLPHRHEQDTPSELARVAALEHYCNTPSLDSFALLGAVADPSPRIRARAKEILGVRLDECASVVLSVLPYIDIDPSGLVPAILSAAHSSSALNTLWLSNLLRQCISAEASYVLRFRAYEFLCTHVVPGDDLIAAVASSMEREQSVTMKLEAASALLNLSPADPAGIETFREAVSSDDGTIVAKALSLLRCHTTTARGFHAEVLNALRNRAECDFGAADLSESHGSVHRLYAARVCDYALDLLLHDEALCHAMRVDVAREPMDAEGSIAVARLACGCRTDESDLALVALLRSDSDSRYTRSAALIGLARYGARTHELVDELELLVEHESGELAAQALAKSGSHGRNALARLLAGRDEWSQVCVLRALEEEPELAAAFMHRVMQLAEESESQAVRTYARRLVN